MLTNPHHLAPVCSFQAGAWEPAKKTRLQLGAPKQLDKVRTPIKCKALQHSQ